MLTRVCRRDNVGWDEEQDRIAQEMVAKQAAVPVSEELQELYNGDPKAYWDEFYAQVKGACVLCVLSETAAADPLSPQTVSSRTERG